jgi:hypothetical protein
MTPHGGGNRGREKKRVVCTLTVSCYIDESASHAENTHFSSQTGVRAG